MKYIILTTFVLFITLNLFAKQNILFSGYVRDSATKEPLIGANIYIKNTNIGTIANAYGYFALMAPEEYLGQPVIISFVGYQYSKGNFNSSENNIFLLTKGLALPEVEVKYKKPIEERNEMSVVNIPMKEIATLPVLIQSDLIKSIQLMPGIEGGMEGSAGMYVRGGNMDQNLVLLDDAPLYYVNHIGNLASIFDNNTIKDFKLYKGAFPARYGGRLSSVLDIKMKEGNKTKFNGEAGLGLISGTFFVEGPIVKNKSSFFFSYRRFWPELVLGIVTKSMYEKMKVGYSFDDISAKVSMDLSKNDKLMVSCYMGGDRLKFTYIPENDSDTQGSKKINWKNMLVSAKYTHAFGRKVFSDVTFYYTNYFYNNEQEIFYTENNREQRFYLQYYSGVSDFSGKCEFDYMPVGWLRLKIGGHFINHWYKPGVSVYSSISSIQVTDTSNLSTIYAFEPSVFTESLISLNDNIHFNLGLRNSYYYCGHHWYVSLEPRIMANINIPGFFALKGSYAEMVQSIHLLSYSGAGFPNDLWIPATDLIPPAKSHQLALGIFKSFNDNKYEISIEGYYKKLFNMVAYKDGMSFFSGTGKWESKLETDGTGNTKGIELFAQKNSGKITGWLSYTISKSDRLFANKNNGLVFPFKYDRRHSFSSVINYNIKPDLTFSAVWVFGTGYPVTLATSYYQVLEPTYKFENIYEAGQYANWTTADNFDALNSVRLRNSHRLDVALTYTKKKRNTERKWNFSIYNLYNRQNPYCYYYAWGNDDKIKLYQQSYLPILPTVGYIIKF